MTGGRWALSVFSALDLLQAQDMKVFACWGAPCLLASIYSFRRLLYRLRLSFSLHLHSSIWNTFWGTLYVAAHHWVSSFLCYRFISICVCARLSFPEEDEIRGLLRDGHVAKAYYICHKTLYKGKSGMLSHILPAHSQCWNTKKINLHIFSGSNNFCQTKCERSTSTEAVSQCMTNSCQISACKQKHISSFSHSVLTNG